MKPGYWILYDFLFGSSILGNIYVLASIGCRRSNLASCYHVLFPVLTFSILGETLFSQADVYNRVADSCIAAMVMSNYFQVMNLVTVLMLFLYHRFTLFRDRFGVKFFILKYGHFLLATVPLIVLFPFGDTYYSAESAYDDDRSNDDTVTTGNGEVRIPLPAAMAVTASQILTSSWNMFASMLASFASESTAASITMARAPIGLLSTSNTTVTSHHHDHSYFCIALPYYSVANFNWTLCIIYIWAMVILLIMIIGIGNMSRVLFYDYSDRTNVYFSDDGSSWRSSQFAMRPTEDAMRQTEDDVFGLDASTRTNDSESDNDSNHIATANNTNANTNKNNVNNRTKKKDDKRNPMINKINMWLINQFFSSVGIYCLVCMFVMWIPRVVFFFYFSFKFKNGADKFDDSQQQLDRAGYYAIGQVFPLFIGNILLTIFFLREQYVSRNSKPEPHPAMERMSEFDPDRLSHMPQDSEYTLRTSRTSVQFVPTAHNSIVTNNPIRTSQIIMQSQGEEGYGYGGKQSTATAAKNTAMNAMEVESDTA